MDDEEAKCYENRYTDLNGMNPNEHYARFGHKQGRNIRCVSFFTQIMSFRYLDRYSELGNLFGRGNSITHVNKKAAKAGREHWFTNGSKQAPPLEIKPASSEEEPYKCSDFGGECKCQGRIHFGLKKRPDSGEEITTLEGLMDWKKG